MSKASEGAPEAGEKLRDVARSLVNLLGTPHDEANVIVSADELNEHEAEVYAALARVEAETLTKERWRIAKLLCVYCAGSPEEDYDPAPVRDERLMVHHHKDPDAMLYQRCDAAFLTRALASEGAAPDARSTTGEGGGDGTRDA